eukprot:NODE_3416_length_972_cov_1127.818935_g2206_i1.p2 GENE.NODE_3416_length_972_cov_1127.818935_g2206_i1~~NODE_3416_length_972_cov_1127.818935_g2206_i1.p2  ORF type:complete len:142 (+),score=57.12 NODE_3416_length_972_cov_1127.818935_g2206_i1:424-849(+)
MLGIKPFFYGLVVQAVYDNGSVYGLDILNMTDDDMKEKFQAGVTNITAISLALGFTTTVSFPHVMMNAFKNMLALSVKTDYSFEAFGADKLRTAIIEGKSLGGPAAPAAPVAAAAAETTKEEAKPVEEEEEDDDMGFGLFD